MRTTLICLVITMSIVQYAVAQSGAVPDSEVQEMQEVLGTGEQPGPAPWKVTYGENTLWILGELTPMPAKVTWRSREVEAVMAKSHELLIDGGGVMTAGGGLAALRYTNRVKKSQKLPKGQILKDVVPADLYARFSSLRQAYAKGDDTLEHMRPLYAGTALRDQALKRLGLTRAGISQSVVKLAEKADVKVPRVRSDLGDPLPILDNVERSSTASCLQESVVILESSRDEMQRLANAWSAGDLDVLRGLVPSRKNDECLPVLLGGEDRAKAIFSEHLQAWLAAAEQALRTNVTTFALVQIDDLFSPDGRLAALRDRGYRVEEP